MTRIEAFRESWKIQYEEFSWDWSKPYTAWQKALLRRECDLGNFAQFGITEPPSREEWEKTAPPEEYNGVSAWNHWLNRCNGNEERARKRFDEAGGKIPEQEDFIPSWLREEVRKEAGK